MIEQSTRLSNKDKSFLALACKAAESSSCEQKHGAVVVKAGRVLAIGYNKTRNSSISLGDTTSFKHCTIHAEIDALSRVSDPRGCIVYVARVNRRGKPRFSRPCNNCYRHMLKRGIKRVVFTI